MNKKIIEYRVHYNKYVKFTNEDKGGYIIKDKTLKTPKEVKEFIKTLNSKDIVKSIGKRTYEKLDLKDFTK